MKMDGREQVYISLVFYFKACLNTGELKRKLLMKTVRWNTDKKGDTLTISSSTNQYLMKERTKDNYFLRKQLRYTVARSTVLELLIFFSSLMIAKRTQLLYRTNL